MSMDVDREEDESFNAELTLSCSPTSPTASGDELGQCEKLQPQPQAQPQPASTATARIPVNPGQQPCGKGRGDTLMSIFYCPPLPQQSPRQPPVCQPHAFVLDAAQMRPPTPAPHSPSSLATPTTTSSLPMPSPISPISLSLNTASAPSAAPPPVLPIPPPRLSSIRVRPLRYGDLGLASVIGKGTPVDRARAGQWAKAGKERPRAGAAGETDKGPVIVVKNQNQSRNPSQSQSQSQSQSPTRIGPETQTRMQSSNDKMFEPDPSIWDAFLATLQQGDAGSSCHGEVGVKKLGVGAGAAAGGSVEMQGESVSAAGTRNGTPSGTTSGVGAGGAASAPSASASATAMNMFGMGFGLGLGMGFVSGSVNHVTALGFGGVDHGVPSSSSSSSPPSSPSSSSGQSSSSAWFGGSTPAGANPGSNPPHVDSLYSSGGDMDMGVSGGSLQTYLPLPMGMMSMSVGMVGVGSVPVPMGMSGMMPVSMSTGGAGMSHNGHSQSAGATTTMVPPAAASAAVPATAGPGTSALSFALG